MRYYIDTEFIDDGHTIDLISIGIVCEDGREYYAQSVEFEPNNASPWVRENVFPHLKKCSTDWPVSGPQHVSGQCRRSDCVWRWRSEIAYEISAFIDPATHGKPEFYGWCSGYDFVAFCQLWGTMMQLPQGYPHYINDLQQELDAHGISDEELPQQESTAHNALDDARHIRHLWGVTCGHYAIDPPILPPYIG